MQSRKNQFLKFFCKKGHCGNTFPPVFGNFHVYVIDPTLCDHGTDTFPRLRVVGIQRKKFEDVSKMCEENQIKNQRKKAKLKHETVNNITIDEFLANLVSYAPSTQSLKII